MLRFRPRPRFWLCTILLVASAVWVLLSWRAVDIRGSLPDIGNDGAGSQLAIVRERQRILQDVFSAGGFVHKGDESATIPEVRKRLGDRAYGFVFVPNHRFTPADVANIKKAFPEAKVVYTSPEKVWRERIDSADN